MSHERSLGRYLPVPLDPGDPVDRLDLTSNSYLSIATAFPGAHPLEAAGRQYRGRALSETLEYGPNIKCRH